MVDDHIHNNMYVYEKNVPQQPAERDFLSWRFNMVAADCDMVAVLKGHIFSV